MTTYLVDNSVLQRVARSELIAERLDLLTSRGHVLASCSVSVDEASYSARSHADFQVIRDRLTTWFTYLDLTSEVDSRVTDIREALFSAGQGRAAGVIDVQLAAVAISHDAVVLHYDQDYEHISGAYPQLEHTWIVSRGTVD